MSTSSRDAYVKYIIGKDFWDRDRSRKKAQRYFEGAMNKSEKELNKLISSIEALGGK